MTLSCLMRGTVAMLLALASSAASAQSTFRITQVFSSMDGVWQFVELTESAGLNGQHHLTGLTLTSSHNGISKQFTIQKDLSTENTAYMSIIVSMTENDWLPPWVWDPPTLWPYYLEVTGMPQRFVPTDGGMIDFAGVDRMTYASLPSDGINALYRDGTVRHATIPRHCLVPCERYEVARTAAVALEYYNAGLDHYFMSASVPDIDALESGRLPGWVPTGQEFFVTSVGDYPVCRFYIPPGEGDSHFFSASIEECEAVRARFPDFVLETPAAFYVPLRTPATGACPPDDGSGVYGIPVYRLWNQRADSNHRYTMSESIRDEMLRRGYADEGVAWCYWTSIWDY